MQLNRPTIAFGRATCHKTRPNTPSHKKPSCPYEAELVRLKSQRSTLKNVAIKAAVGKGVGLLFDMAVKSALLAV